VAFIRPFRAWRYDTLRVPDLKSVVAPLFDVVNEEQRAQLLAQPDNAIHLTNPQSTEQAKATWHRLVKKHTVAQDGLPAIYPYYQYYNLYGEQTQRVRKGFVAWVRIEPEDDAADIIPHEQTMPGSVAGMVQLYQALGLQLSPTHGLYADPDQLLEQLMDPYMRYPLHSVMDYQRVVNQLSAIQHAEQVRTFQRVMQGKTIWLADGHHRLASSRQYLRNLLAREPHLPQEHPARYHLMYLTNLAGEEQRILPTHRVLSLPNGVNAAALRQRLSEWFRFTELDMRQPLYAHFCHGQRAIGFLAGEDGWRMELLPGLKAEDLTAHLPLAPVVRRLVYTLLHGLVLDRLAGIPYGEQSRNPAIRYVKEYTAAAEAALEPGTVSFLMPEVSLTEMMDVCQAGELMPPKSTFFYPKVVTGLTFSDYHDDLPGAPFDSGFTVAP
jgi:uncharacterized protein (DUF1015 family)